MQKMTNRTKITQKSRLRNQVKNTALILFQSYSSALKNILRVRFQQYFLV